MKPRTRQLAIIGTAASIGMMLIIVSLQQPIYATEISCTDGIDNDNDGFTDDDDPDCGAPPPNETSCTDGIDNDQDGLTDMADPDCTTPPTKETNCTDGIDNDGDGFVDSADSDCLCPQWYHYDGTACVADAPNYGMILQDLGLDTTWQGAYYDGGKWRVLIDNPFYLETSPPAPKNLYYLVRWVGPDGVIYDDTAARFCACGGSLNNKHVDPDDEIAVGGIYIPLGKWQVHIFATTSIDDLRQPVGKQFQFIGSDEFTATEEQSSILQKLLSFIT